MAAARLTVQNPDYDGSSFRELAKDVGIKSANTRYYFPTTGEFGQALAARCTADFSAYIRNFEGLKKRLRADLQHRHRGSRACQGLT